MVVDERKSLWLKAGRREGGAMEGEWYERGFNERGKEGGEDGVLGGFE